MTNTGARDGDEVVLLYHSAGADVKAKAKHPTPRRALVDFARVSVSAGGKASVRFEVGEATFKLVDEFGEKRIYTGEHLLTARCVEIAVYL